MARRTAPWRPDLSPVRPAAPEQVPPREGQTLAGESLPVRLANLVRLPHTVFALPFALLGVVYASRGTPVTARQVAVVILAFTAARFAAMGFNRIVDREVDAQNPRTRGRELPAGKLSVSTAVAAVVVACGVFIGAAGALNRLCLILSPLALVWVLAYSYAKRYTSWAHFWLGASLAIAPAGGYLAITGSWSRPAWTLVAIAAAVTLWVGGFDIFYALQDEEFDHAHRLKSAIVLLGRRRGMLLARLAHGLAIAMLLVFGWGAGFGAIYFAGVAVGALLVGWEHHLVKPDDLSRLNAAFFTMNGVMSVVVLLGALGDRVL